MSLILVLPLFLLACGAGLWAIRRHPPAMADLSAVMLCTLSTVALTGAMVVAFEAGRSLSRLLALAALLFGAAAMAGCLTVMLRLTAPPSQEP